MSAWPRGNDRVRTETGAMAPVDTRVWAADHVGAALLARGRRLPRRRSIPCPRANRLTCYWAPMIFTSARDVRN